jgi:hypothetical protein
VDDELARLDAVARDGFREELLGERAVLALGHHPGHDVAAEEVEDDVEVEENAADQSRKLADIPRPDLVWRRGNQPRNRVFSALPVVASVPQFTTLAKDAIHRSNRAEEAAFLEQRRIDLARRLVDESLGVQELEYRAAFRLRQPSVVRTTWTTHSGWQRA